MFFVISKVFWFFIQPLNLAIFLLLAGVIGLFLGWRRLSAAGCVSAFLILGLATWTSLGAVLMNPLEERFQRPSLPEKVDGIVVLGGGLEGAINLARGGYEMNSAGDRFVEAAVLARRFPDAKIVISGGVGTLVLEGEGDADTAPRLLSALGVAPERMVLENQSRNTYENAVFTKRLVTPKPGETWLLVTSAFHMPRSMALFRKADFSVLPWPVDYRTSGEEGVGFFRDNPQDSLQNTTMAIREWIGLVAYWLSGRIDSPFPGPA
ncbi:YdcF family protein [Mesorhizobium sp. DCY119]|uniref:YdcF family protein n=1 Tax=Mesorhizobium sp. DCY119 TaxID=2108445 RepID=UPI000E6BCDA9|nr:YdcF family protein [Mesorhizobium sp. DCY119]RJG45377.1 YdcF family protein [Mesorhizobium sp. DCY119]